MTATKPPLITTSHAVIYLAIASVLILPVAAPVWLWRKVFRPGWRYL